MSSRFHDKRALVTGGSQGIGLAIAARLAQEGAKVAVVASSRREKAAAAIAAFPDPGRHLPEACDVRDVTEVNALVGRVSDRFGGIDLLVSAAGVFYPTPLGDTNEANYDRMVDINLKGTWNLINAVSPRMKSEKAGKIVNIASVAGVMGLASYAVYCATKAGIIMMTRALATELAPHGVNINCVAPGNTSTPMNEDIRTKPELKPFLDAMAARTPSPRVYSEAGDMAAIACFLLSEDARAMHGSCVLADEGFSAGIF